MMNPIDAPHDMHKQALAEAAERSGAPCSSDADVEAYRCVMRAAATPPFEQLPADFARDVAAMLSMEEQVGLFERGLPLLCALALVAAGLTTYGGFFSAAFREIIGSTLALGVDRLPWPMLLTAALALGVTAMSDRLFGWRS